MNERNARQRKRFACYFMVRLTPRSLQVSHVNDSNDPKQAAKSAKKLMQQKKALEKQRRKTHKMFQKFDMLLETANEEISVHHHVDMPALLKRKPL